MVKISRLCVLGNGAFGAMASSASNGASPAPALRAFRRLARLGGSAPPPGHQIDIGSRLKERIGRGFDAIHPRNRVEDDVLLFAGIVRSDFPQTDFAERELRTVLGPADRGIVNGAAVPRQLYEYAEPDCFLCNPLLDLVEEEVWTARGGFGLAKILVARDRQHPVAPVAALPVRV